MKYPHAVSDWPFSCFLLPCFSGDPAALPLPENQTAEEILASIKPKQVKNMVNQVAGEVLGNFKVCYLVAYFGDSCKFRIRSDFSKHITKKTVTLFSNVWQLSLFQYFRSIPSIVFGNTRSLCRNHSEILQRMRMRMIVEFSLANANILFLFFFSE